MVTQGQNSASDGGISGDGGSTSGTSKLECPARIRKLPAKFKDALTDSGSMQASKIRRTTAITDDEDKAQPAKKKPKTRLLVEGEPNTDTDQVSLNEGPNQKNACVFSQASEDAQDTRANTDVSSNQDDDGGEESQETNSNAKGCATDEEEWGYSQLDEMASKDAQVSKTHYP